MPEAVHPTDHEDQAADEAVIRQVVGNFADAWNRHDPTAMLAAFADDLDHVSVRGRWQQGRAELERTHHDNHATIWKEITYHAVVEKVRFLRPDVAVVIVRGTFRTMSAVDEALATWVMSKDDGRWLIRAFHQTYVQDVPIVPSAT